MYLRMYPRAFPGYMVLLPSFTLGPGVKMPITEFQLFRNPLLDNFLAKERYIDYSERQRRLKNMSKTPAGRRDRGGKKRKRQVMETDGEIGMEKWD